MRQARRRLVGAGALSLALHGALLTGLWLDRPPPPPPEAPVFELTLVRPPERSAPPQATPPPVAPASATAEEQEREVATPPRVRRAPGAPAPGYSIPNAVQGAEVDARPAPTPATPFTPLPSPPVRDGPRLGDVLRAEFCSDNDRLTAREQEACRERLGRSRAAGPPPPTVALRRALEAADDARAKASRRVGETFDDPHVAQCAGSGLCRRELKGVPFGNPPPALPVIPPSTLRGDDDALRPKPRP